MEKEKCVIYVRVSTEMQVDGFSLSAQKECLYEYAQRNNLEVVKEYEDAGKSGKSIEGRPSFQNMLNDISNGLGIQYVLVFKLSRFGRSAADVLNSVQFIKDFGVSLISVSDGINSSTSSGILIISVLSAVAEIERENILEQTMAGRREKARQGKWNGGFAPYGYELKDDILVIKEDEAKVVKFIYETYGYNKMFFNDLIKYLNINYPKPLKTKKSIPLWNERSIRYILDNPIYTGMMPYGRRTREKIKGTKNEYHTVHKEKFMLEKGMHEPIVSMELFELVQKRRKALAESFREARKYVYLLSNLILCPICHHPLMVFTRTYKDSNGEQYRGHYYLCDNHKHNKKDYCSFATRVPADVIESIVVDIIDKLSNQENLKNILEKEFNSSNDISKLEIEISTYEKNLSDLNKKKNHIISQIDTLSSFDPSYEAKYADLNHRLDKFYNDIGLLETMITKAREKLSINTAKNNNSEAVLTVFKGIGSIIKKVSRDEQAKIIHKVIDGILLKEEYKEGENPISKIFFKMPLFKNQASTNEIEFDSKNLPIIYKTLEANDKIDVIVDIKDIIGKIKVPTITFEHYKSESRNRAGKAHTYDEVVQYIQNKYNTYVTKNYITEVRNTVLGKDHHQYTPKGFKFDIIKEALEYYEFI